MRVHNASKTEFINTSDKLLDMYLDFKPTRVFYRTIHAFDIILEELLPLNVKALVAIRVVTITNAEFQDFLTGAVRMIPESAGKSVTVDLGPASTLNVPSLMGIIRKYPVDVQHLYPGENIDIETVDVKFHHLVFAALKACLRSTISRGLETSLDSTPLFKAFLNMNEVVYMG